MLTLGAIFLGSILVSLGVEFVATFADVRDPVELLGVPGIAALPVLIVCRDPRRRDLSLQWLIYLSTVVAFVASVVALAFWPNAALGAYWALVLGCVLACWGLYWHWRTR